MENVNKNFSQPLLMMVQIYSSLTGVAKKNYYWCISDMIRRNTNFYKQKYISKTIAEHFAVNFPEVNPFILKWEYRKNYGVEGKKSSIVFEHTTPIGVITKKILKMKTENEILDELNSYSGISLISRNEDNLLAKKGYRTKRYDWVSAYSECGIEVMTESEYNDYKNSLMVVK